MLRRTRGLYVALLTAWGSPAVCEEIRTYSVKAKFDDVRMELDTAILARGLNTHSTGNIAMMLDRTGADVGSTKPVYIAAEFVTFCSAKLSRRAMEADPSNVALCPFGISIYQTIEKPDEVTVAYRRLTSQPKATDGLTDIGVATETTAALADINALLDGIAKDALK
jgi:uncharacterized protein (DUF302 family)